MSLKDTIEKNYLESYKAKDENTIAALRAIRSSIKNMEINERKDATEEDVIRILKKEAKQRQDSIAEFDKAGRIDLADKEKTELEIIANYLPEEMGEDEIRKIVTETISEIGATGLADTGKVIPEVIKKTAGKADNSVIAKIVREKLQ